MMISNQIKGLLILLLLVNILSCSTNPYAATNRFYQKKARMYAKVIVQHPSKKRKANSDINWVATTNYNLRKPNYVIIHHTAQDSVKQTLRTFTLERTSVSSHYVIAKDGTIYQMLNDYFRAWHAGAGKWGSNSDINSSSLGIELDNNGSEPFPEVQINSLLRLLDTLKEKYNIPVENFLGHADIAPIRKTDPSVFFPWKNLADKGFGIWYNDTISSQNDTLDIIIPYDSIPAMDSIPNNKNIPDFNVTEALKIIGYDISNPQAALRAFKLHYIQICIDEPLNDSEKQILYQVYQKFLHL